MKKMLIILLMLLTILGASSCSWHNKVAVIDKPVYEPTPMPNINYASKLEEWENRLGTPPQPRQIKIDGMTYVAFTPEDFKKVVMRSQMTSFTSGAVKTMYENQEYYIMEINKWKKLYYNRSMELRDLQLEVNR